MMEVCFNSGPTERTRQKRMEIDCVQAQRNSNSFFGTAHADERLFFFVRLYLYVDSFFRFDAKHVQETKSQITFPEMTHNESHNEERIDVSGCVCVCVRRKPDPKM